MILFCEDCGRKNYLEQPGITDDTVMFRCTSCEYLNSISVKSLKRRSPYCKPIEPEDKTDVFFDMIQSIPDITGSFLYHVEKGVLKNRMPAVLEPQDLIFLGKSLVKNYKICSFVYSDITRMILVIDGRNLVLQMIDTDLALILSCKHFPISPSVENLLTRKNLDRIHPKA